MLTHYFSCLLLSLISIRTPLFTLSKKNRSSSKSSLVEDETLTYNQQSERSPIWLIMFDTNNFSDAVWGTFAEKSQKGLTAPAWPVLQISSDVSSENDDVLKAGALAHFTDKPAAEHPQSAPRMTTLLGTYGGRAKPGSAIAPTAAQTRTDSRQEAEQLVANKTGTCFTLSSWVPARGECMKCGLECRASDERVWSIISPRAAWAPQLYLPAILMLNLILSASSPLSPSTAPPPHTHHRPTPQQPPCNNYNFIL